MELEGTRTRLRWLNPEKDSLASMAKIAPARIRGARLR